MKKLLLLALAVSACKPVATWNEYRPNEGYRVLIRSTLVSRAEFEECVDDGACAPRGEGSSVCDVDADEPVNCVSYTQARDFASWYGARLPLPSEVPLLELGSIWAFHADGSGRVCEGLHCEAPGAGHIFYTTGIALGRTMVPR